MTPHPLTMLGTHLNEAWKVIEEWKLNILGTEVTVQIQQQVFPDGRTGQFMAMSSHGIISAKQATSYVSMQMQATAAEALRDWIGGISMFAGNPGARMEPRTVP